MQIYGLLEGKGLDSSYYHYFIRGKDGFHYLGNFSALSYKKEWDVFSSVDGDFYRLDGYKLVSETQKAQIESLSDGSCNPCELDPIGQEPFTFSYTIDDTSDGAGYPLVIQLNKVKFDNLKMYQLGYLATNEFYQIKFFDDHRFQIYGFPTGEGGGTHRILRSFISSSGEKINFIIWVAILIPSFIIKSRGSLNLIIITERFTIG